ncbi:hypothetical protein FAGAP_8963 [Fusarium agapanthi]|uniref:Uncharacterized protein n=1 Tax=Fusarium agapanthi TaxID=1803897 RepID=A0A9P5B365_9HYPO|nr:hypothetical protein FAGAP_8963 [Fusarium agapanthi]
MVATRFLMLYMAAAVAVAGPCQPQSSPVVFSETALTTSLLETTSTPASSETLTSEPTSSTIIESSVTSAATTLASAETTTEAASTTTETAAPPQDITCPASHGQCFDAVTSLQEALVRLSRLLRTTAPAVGWVAGKKGACAQ